MAQFDRIPRSQFSDANIVRRASIARPSTAQFLNSTNRPIIADNPSQLTTSKALQIGGNILNFLDRPRSSVVNIIQDYTETGRFTPFTSFYKGISGQEQPLMSDVFSDLGWEPTSTSGKIVKGVTGFAGDVATDPLSYIGVGGLTKLGRIRQTVSGLQKNTNILYEGGRFFAKEGKDVGRLQKTITKMNDILGSMPGQDAANLINNSGKILTKSEEAARGYRAMLRVGPGGGVPVVAGGRFYDKQKEIANLTMEVPFLRSIRNKFIQPYKGDPEIEAIRASAEALAGKYKFEAKTLLGEFYDGVKNDKNLTPDLIRQIPTHVEFSHNTQKITEIFGEQSVADKEILAPHIARLTKLRDYAQSVLGENGVLIQDTHTYLRNKLDDLTANKKFYIEPTDKDAVPFSIVKEEGRAPYYVEANGKVPLKPPKKIKDTKTLRKNIVAGKYVPTQGMGEQNYETVLTATKELYESAPSWLPHFLTDDAAFQLSRFGKGKQVSGMMYDEKTASFITRKFSDKNGVPLGVEEVNDLIQKAGTNLTNNEPIFKKETFLSSLLKRKNKALAIQYDNIAHLPDVRDKWLQDHADDLGELFNTDPATIADTIVQRTAKSIEEGVFQNEMVKRFGLTEEALAQMKGIPVEQLKNADVNVLGGYRKIKLDRLKNIKDLPDEFVGHLKNITEMSNTAYFPNEIANVLESMYNGLGEHYQDFASFVHKSTNLMKAWLTVPNPAFHGRNLISSLWMSYTDNVHPLRNFSDYSDAMKLNHYARNKDVEAIKRMKIAGYSGDEVLKMLNEHGVIGLHYWDIGQLDKKLSTAEKSNWINWINPFDSQQFVPFIAGRKTMEYIEDHVRSAHFIAKLNAGLSPAEAAKQVAKIHYKYSDVTQFESGVMAQLLPFYRWMRFNTPRMIEVTMQNPVKVLGTMHAVRNAQDILTDKDYADEILLPKWLQENMGMQVTKQGGHTGFMALGSFFPFGMLAQFNSPKDAVEYIKGSLNPAIKTVIETGLNIDSYFGTEIEKYPNQTESFLGMEIPKKWLKVIKLARPLNELDRVFVRSKGQENEPSVLRKVMDIGFGIKISDQDMVKQHKYKVIELKDQNSKIKFDIQKANKEGNAEKAQRLREQIGSNNRMIADLNYALTRALNGRGGR